MTSTIELTQTQIFFIRSNPLPNSNLQNWKGCYLFSFTQLRGVSKYIGNKHLVLKEPSLYLIPSIPLVMYT